MKKSTKIEPPPFTHPDIEAWDKPAILRLLQRHIDASGSQSALARKWGIHAEYISAPMRGTRGVGPIVAEVLGLKRITLWVVASKPARRKTEGRTKRAGPITEWGTK